MKAIGLTRIQLYRLVWSNPLSKISKKYSISDRHLREICKKKQYSLAKIRILAKTKI